MQNTLLDKAEYKVVKTGLGTWRSFGYQNGTSFHEFKSNATWLGLPLIHYTYGRSPETGRRVCAKGVIAVGRLAMGIIAIGHASMGVIAIGQLAIGFLFGLGQLSTGIAAVAQAAIGVYFGLGQLATGYIAIGQIALGKYVLAQLGVGTHVLSAARKDPQAIEFFKTLPILRNILH
ncbi:MAG: hypothetical protein JW749_10335 [Sedimentisphaerales bacterium]|nr:hypothetical protein [Sedimentisphaerales bacterium]